MYFYVICSILGIWNNFSSNRSGEYRVYMVQCVYKDHNIREVLSVSGVHIIRITSLSVLQKICYKLICLFMVIPVDKHTNGDSGESILHNE